MPRCCSPGSPASGTADPGAHAPGAALNPGLTVTRAEGALLGVSVPIGVDGAGVLGTEVVGGGELGVGVLGVGVGRRAVLGVGVGVGLPGDGVSLGVPGVDEGACDAGEDAAGVDGCGVAAAWATAALPPFGPVAARGRDRALPGQAARRGARRGRGRRTSGS